MCVLIPATTAVLSAVYIFVLIQLYTPINVSSYSYECVLILLHMCSHTPMYVYVYSYVSSYSYICVLILLYVSTYSYICVLIPATTAVLSAAPDLGSGISSPTFLSYL